MAQFHYMYFDLFELKLADGEESVHCVMCECVMCVCVCAILDSIDIRQNVLCGLALNTFYICVANRSFNEIH